MSRSGRPSKENTSNDFLQDFPQTEEGKRWLTTALHKGKGRPKELKGTGGERVPVIGDLSVEKLLAALREPLTLDTAKAEWIAEQLLEAGEHGILLPLNVVLDAYVRGKSRYYLRKHALRSAAAVAVACGAVHLGKLVLKKATSRIKYVGPAVSFVLDIALPTSVIGPLLMARIML